MTSTHCKTCHICHKGELPHKTSTHKKLLNSCLFKILKTVLMVEYYECMFLYNIFCLSHHIQYMVLQDILCRNRSNVQILILKYTIYFLVKLKKILNSDCKILWQLLNYVLTNIVLLYHIYRNNFIYFFICLDKK